MKRRTRLAAGLVALAAIAVSIPLSESQAHCDPRTAVCDPDNPGNPDADGKANSPRPAVVAARRGIEPLEDVRRATRRFREVDKAIDAGYVQFFGCVHEPLVGSMGIHFVNGPLAQDTVIDAATPEALMYEVRTNGQLALVGVEYVVFQEAWDAEHDEPPSLFGEDFVLVPANNRYGIPPFYELHAWAWKSNPVGAFEDWNPKVLCTNTEGHVHGG